MRIKDKWFDKVCESYLSPPVFYNGQQLPGFPSDQLQANTTGQSGVKTLKEAFIFSEDCQAAFAEIGRPIGPERKLLDFGVGWGRIARFFLNEIPVSNLSGVDVTGDFIEICRETYQSENFFKCNPFPPCDLPDNEFDYITGYSVFSHLSEEACKAWMSEFNRLLLPGGIVAVTTRGRPFFDFCENLVGLGHDGYLGGLSRMFDDFSDARAKYDQGQFVHSNSPGVNGGGEMNGTFYGETFIPEDYARKAYSNDFVFEKFVFNQKRQTHPILFFRKK